MDDHGDDKIETPVQDEKPTRTLSMHYRLTHDQEITLRELCHISKNLYNETIYTIEHRESGSKFPSEFDLYKMMRGSQNYQLLAARGQETIKLVHKSYKSFFGLVRKRKRGEYEARAHPPRYLPRDDYYPVLFSYICFGFNGKSTAYDSKNKKRYPAKNQRNITLTFSKAYKEKLAVEGRECTLKFKVPPYLRRRQINMVRVIPRYDGREFKIEYIYEELPPEEAAGSGVIAIDLGVRNFVAYATSDGEANLIDGLRTKSVNRRYNAEQDRLKSIRDISYIRKRIGSVQGVKARTRKMTRHMIGLAEWRDQQINEALNQIVAYLIKKCIQKKITTVAVGELKNIKRRSNLGKSGNRRFHQIPYDHFKQKLAAKCQLYGIKYVEVNEAYTSQADALALDEIKKQPYGRTRRITRELYQSSTGKLLNADINGALNILRKVGGDSMMDSYIRGGWPPPARIRVGLETMEQSESDERAAVETVEMKHQTDHADQTSSESNGCSSSHPHKRGEK